MIYISHRCNIDGLSKKQNSFGQAMFLMDMYDWLNIELDIWFKNGDFYLGHDEPEKKLINEEMKTLCKNKKIWLHCKNIETISHILNRKNLKCNVFFHETDQCTLTYPTHKLWTFPKAKLTNRSICVLPEKVNYDIQSIKSCYAICSDYILMYRSLIENA
jgi:hypothetical protein